MIADESYFQPFLRAIARARMGVAMTLFASVSATVFTAEASSTPSPPTASVTVLQPPEEMGLSLDAATKEHVALPGETSYVFKFAVTNVSPSEIVINQVRTSCGCTVAKLPSQPWKLGPHQTGEIELTANFLGKTGEFIKTATIDTPSSFKTFTIKVIIPPVDPAVTDPTRIRNVSMASADRQAIFRGDCAKCHAEPTVGQKGAALYAAACSVCHDAPHRATFVPDLHALSHPTDKTFWRTIVAQGKPGTLMPAFAKGEGGPLTEEQIDSLSDYLSTAFRPIASPAQPSSSAATRPASH
jgi:cytochrome c553